MWLKKKFKNENEKKKTLVIIDDYNILTRKGKQRKKENPYKGEFKIKKTLAQLIKNISKIA